MRLLLAIVQITVAAAFSPLYAPMSELRPAPAAAAPSVARPLMMAKKKTKRKDGSTAKNTMGGGFGVDRSESSTAAAAPPAGAEKSSTLQSSASRAERVDSVLQARGITPSDSRPQRRADAPLDPLARIPKSRQALLERFFGGGAILTGAVFIVSGIAVSVEALCKVLDKPLPAAVDGFLVNSVEPILTPSILTLFFFSISLGLLKQLQFSSESAGVLYREDDD
jgi:hypothetical protein